MRYSIFLRLLIMYLYWVFYVHICMVEVCVPSPWSSVTSCFFSLFSFFGILGGGVLKCWMVLTSHVNTKLGPLTGSFLHMLSPIWALMNCFSLGLGHVFQKWLFLHVRSHRQQHPPSTPPCEDSIQGGLRLVINTLPGTPECWNYKCELPCLSLKIFF